MDFVELSFVAIAVGLGMLALQRRRKNFPPGPNGIPILGSLPFLGSNIAEKITDLRRRYGAVLSIQIGADYWVILNSYDAIKTAFLNQGDAFSGRPLFKVVSHDDGLVFTQSEVQWKTLKRFGHVAFRNLGMTGAGAEGNVRKEIPFLLERLTTANGETVRHKLALATSNLVCRLLFGSRFSYDDQKFRDMMDITILYSRTLYSKVVGLMYVNPKLSHLPGFRWALNRRISDIQNSIGIMEEFIDDHLNDYNENETRGFVDAFFHKMNNTSGEDGVFCKETLLHYTIDILEGGTATTSATVLWSLLAFIHFPECQEKIAKEIEKVVGPTAPVTFAHNREMPYTMAFIQEIMRHRTITPLGGIFHRTTKDTLLNGYDIPKNTTVAANLWSVHHDPNLFENPSEFRPERFLDSDGGFILSRHVMPFVMGPRRCMGEKMGQIALFLIISNIVRRFKIVPVEGKSVPAFEKGVFTGVGYETDDFDVSFEKRGE